MFITFCDLFHALVATKYIAPMSIINSYISITVARSYYDGVSLVCMQTYYLVHILCSIIHQLKHGSDKLIDYANCSAIVL